MTSVTTSSAVAYGATAKFLHWLIAVLLVIQFVISILMPAIGRNTVPGTLINLHFSFGITILAVMIVRLVQRLRQPVALDLRDSPPWERWTARGTHLAFYAILLVAPFLGWASASAHKLPVSVFGVIPLPELAAPRARWALTAGDVHTYAMWALLGLIALHALAALYHRFIRRDGVLDRMLPTR